MDHKTLLKRLTHIKVLLTDVDGVWTDGSLIYGKGGEEIKIFHVHDGLGIKMLLEKGIDIIVVSARYSEAVQKRCLELGVKNIYQGVQNKTEILDKLMRKYTPEEIAYVGDDLPDLAIFPKVGVAFAVSNAVKAVKEKAHYVTVRPGGKGALREIADLILSVRFEA